MYSQCLIKGQQINSAIAEDAEIVLFLAVHLSHLKVDLAETRRILIHAQRSPLFSFLDAEGKPVCFAWLAYQRGPLPLEREEDEVWGEGGGCLSQNSVSSLMSCWRPGLIHFAR